MVHFKKEESNIRGKKKTQHGYENILTGFFFVGLLRTLNTNKHVDCLRKT